MVAFVDSDNEKFKLVLANIHNIIVAKDLLLNLTAVVNHTVGTIDSCSILVAIQLARPRSRSTKFVLLLVP